MFRIGHGYDVHKLQEERKLVLGGIEIPHTKGCLGHSDADVLVHAVMDSIIGAMAMGDIGKWFPDTDEKYKGVDSMKLLSQVILKMNEKGYEIGNIDCTILAQKPKLANYIDAMRNNLSKAFLCDIGNISIKATTEEKLGFTGEEKGIACHCVCLLKRK